MKKSGFTLIELLVYMGIMGFIIVVAGRVFSDSTAMRVRSHNMLKSAEASGKISELIKEDISQMGVKSWGHSSSSGYEIEIDTNVYWNRSAGDSSSYELIHVLYSSASFDNLTFKKAEFNKDGELLGVRQISWYAKGEKKELWRSCKTVSPSSCHGDDDDCKHDCPVGDPYEVLIATNVTMFALTPSKPGVSGNSSSSGDTLFSILKNPGQTLKGRPAGGKLLEVETTPRDNLNRITVANENSNFEGDDSRAEVYLVESDGEDWGDCATMKFKKGETYVVEFNMPVDAKDSNVTQFLPGIDHIAVGLRAGENEIDDLRDVLFYPPQSIEAANLKRHAEFSIGKNDVDACVALTLAFYSKKVHKGKMYFKDFAVYRKTDEAFHFPKDEPNYGAGVPSGDEEKKIKKNVKAFELAMDVEYSGEKVKTYTENEDKTNSGMIIMTPNNGIGQ